MDRSALGFSNEEEGQTVASRHLHSATKSVSSQTPNPIPPRVSKAISGSAFEGKHSFCSFKERLTERISSLKNNENALRWGHGMSRRKQCLSRVCTQRRQAVWSAEAQRDFCKTLAGKIFDISSTDFSFPSVCFESCPEGKLGFLRGTLLSWRTALRDNWFLITLETDDMKCSAFFCRLIKSLGGSQPGCRRGCTFCPSASAGCIVFVKIFFRAQKVKFLLVGTRVLLDAETQSIVNGSEQAST